MISRKVAIVGGGPVGLLGSLLLQKFGIDFVCFQKHERLRSHPSAHWVSARSKQILSQISGLSEQMDRVQQNFQKFRYYRYVQSICGRQFGKKDQFYPSISNKLEHSLSLFGQYPNHISQNRLVELQFAALRNKNNVFFDNEINKILEDNDEYLLMNSKNEAVGRAKYVILSNGFNSTLRDSLGIEMGEGKNFYKLVNIHFKSKELAEQIIMKKTEAMLHFVYNNSIPCVLVNHSLADGQFVLQIPNYEPFIDLLQVYTPLQLIKTVINEVVFEEIKSNINIVHVGRWKLQAQIASKMINNRIFLAGDTAHTYTPAGGFGMNCGFQDINQLVHTIHLLQRNPQSDFNKISEMYNCERRNTNQKYLQKSLQNYGLTQQTASQLGFPPQLTNYYFQFCQMLPIGTLSLGMSITEKMRLLAMQGLFKPRTIQPRLELFFDDFDVEVQRRSKNIAEMLKMQQKGQIYDLWVDSEVPDIKIIDYFGQIQPQNILRKSLNGQKIVRRDGIVLQ